MKVVSSPPDVGIPVPVDDRDEESELLDEEPAPNIFPHVVVFLLVVGASGGRCRRTPPYFVSYLL